MLVHMNSSFLFVYIPILLAHKWLACKLSTIADIHPELQQCTHIYIWHMGKLCLCQRHTVPILTPDRLTHLEFRILREDGPELSQRPVITRIRSKNDVFRRSHNGIRTICEGNTNMWFFYMMLGSMYWFYCTTLWGNNCVSKVHQVVVGGWISQSDEIVKHHTNCDDFSACLLPLVHGPEQILELVCQNKKVFSATLTSL